MTRIKSKLLKRITYCLSILLFLTCLPIQTLAAEGSDPLSLAIFHKVEEKAVADVEFSIYAVADEKGNLTGSFKNYPVSLKGLDSAGLKNAAETLSGYAIRDNIKAFESTKTDANGVAVFPVEKTLKKGIYLIIGKSYSTETYVCNVQPILLSLPNVDENGNALYEVKIESKFELIEKDKTTQMSVVKVWKDKTEHYRPSKIEVQLIDNESGKIHDTVALNKDNNWRYTWTGLPEGHVWSVVEKNVPEYYTVSSEKEGLTVKLTNTSEKEYTPPKTPDKEPGQGTPSDSPTPQKGNKLPQTGTWWWPVPVLAGLGLAFLIIGLIRRQRNE